MERSRFLFTLALLAGLGASAVQADNNPGSLSPFKPKFLPVLIQVDSNGAVTGASPAIPLSPALTRQMNSDLNRLVGNPIIAKYRKSYHQFVAALALNVSPRPDGKLDAFFSMADAYPVPAGQWYWVNIEDRRFALANASTQQRLNIDAGPSFHNSNSRATFSPPSSSNTSSPGGSGAKK